jgi:V8-like Glu-specific endopeptidase
MLGVAFAATPVLAADSVAGNKVSAPTVNRDAPASIPAGAKPLPVPQVDPSSLSRGPLGLDPTSAADSMGTLTHSSDGSDTETPASQALRDILSEAVKGNNPDAGSTSRVVTGTDDRAQITDTSTFPAATVGWIVGQTQKGDYYTCTGTLIGPNSVITAAHCVYDHESGGWAKDLVFVPGATDAQTAPFGVFEWDNANILKGYVSNYDGKNYGSSMPWDLAEITLKDDAGNQIGWQGFRVDDATEFKAISMGYPGDKPDGTMWTEKCDIPPANFGDQIFIHDCDTYAGSSGSSMWEDAGGGDLYIRGINVAEDDKENWGVRLIKPYFQFLQDNYK